MGSGLLKSFLVYYGIPFRLRRMKQLYARFLRPGSLAFDIGSHLGNRLRAFTRLGARAVAAEPSPDCVRALTRFYGRRSTVVIEPVAVGAESGTATLHVSRRTPTLNTISAHWMEQVKSVHIFDRVEWNSSISVPLVTLDALIAKHGIPDFTKIDVEGSEPEVLKGLSQPLPAISFELLPASKEGALECIELLESLGSYEYNYSPVETMRFQWSSWRGPEDMALFVQALPREGRSGDIYAVRRDRARSHSNS